MSVSTGWKHSLFIEEATGAVLACGNNQYGQLGLGDVKLALQPTKIVNLPEIKIITSGYCNSLFLDRSGRVWSCGDNQHGQLGLEDDTTTTILPKKIRNIKNIKLISSGSYHSLFLDVSGLVWACGNNKYGQLGLGDTRNRALPQKILTLPKIANLSAGGGYSLFLDEQGNPWSCGNNEKGQLGFDDLNARSKPEKIVNFDTITMVSAGRFHTLFLDASGDIWSCGSNDVGQLGFSDLQNRNKPEKIAQLKNISQISAGGNHSVVLDRSGCAWGFGGNNSGQIGVDLNTIKYSPPVELQLPTIQSISAGWNFSIFLDENGSVWGCGNNDSGQLGFIEAKPTFVPAQIPNLPTVLRNPLVNNAFTPTIKTPKSEITSASLLEQSLANWDWKSVMSDFEVNDAIRDDIKNLNGLGKEEQLVAIKQQILQGKISFQDWEIKWSDIHERQILIDDIIKDKELTLQVYQEKLNLYKQMVLETELLVQDASNSLTKLKGDSEKYVFYDELLPAVATVESKLKKTFFRKVNNPSSFSVNDVSIFLILANLPEFIGPFREHNIDGKTLLYFKKIGFFGDFEMCKIKLYKYHLSMLKNQLFLNEKHNQSCIVCKNSTADSLIELTKEFNISLDSEIIKQKKLGAPQLIFFSMKNLKELFGLNNVTDCVEIFLKLQNLKNQHLELVKQHLK